MSKHTPGPWVAEYLHGRSSHWDYIVKMPRDYVGIDTRNAEADARLIAAAPDLLFQLLAASNYIDALGGDSKSYRAAIARATGEPQ